MSELRVTLANGVTLTIAQVMAVKRHMDELPHCHWHLNECGCCVTVHGPDCAYIIGEDGGEDCYPGRGCGCPPEAPWTSPAARWTESVLQDDEPGPIPGESPDPDWMNP